MARFKVFIIGCCILFTILLVLGPNYMFQPESRDPSLFGGSVIPDISATPHAPIYITGNASFTGPNGVTGGTGQPGEPFIIEGWEIDAGGTGSYCITIENTTAFFIVRDCVLTGAAATAAFTAGVFLNESFNGIVANNSVSRCICGIFVRMGGNNTITNNTCSGVIQSRITPALVASEGIAALGGQNITISLNHCLENDRGIYVQYGNWYTIVNNTCTWNSLVGIGLQSCDNATVTANNCSNNQEGFNGLYGDYCVVRGNVFADDRLGIRLSTEEDFDLSDNNFVNLSWMGILIGDSARGLIARNRVSRVANVGIHLHSTNETKILDNTCRENPLSLFLAECQSCEVAGNYIEFYSGWMYQLDCITIEGGAGMDIHDNQCIPVTGPAEIYLDLLIIFSIAGAIILPLSLLGLRRKSGVDGVRAAWGRRLGVAALELLAYALGPVILRPATDPESPFPLVNGWFYSGYNNAENRFNYLGSAGVAWLFLFVMLCYYFLFIELGGYLHGRTWFKNQFPSYIFKGDEYVKALRVHRNILGGRITGIALTFVFAIILMSPDFAAIPVQVIFLSPFWVYFAGSYHAGAHNLKDLRDKKGSQKILHYRPPRTLRRRLAGEV